MSALCIFFLQEKRKGIGEGDTGREFLLDIGRSGEGSYREVSGSEICHVSSL